MVVVVGVVVIVCSVSSDLIKSIVTCKIRYFLVRCKLGHFQKLFKGIMDENMGVIVTGIIIC